MKNKHLGDMYMSVYKVMKHFKQTGNPDDAKRLLYGTHSKWYDIHF